MSLKKNIILTFFAGLALSLVFQLANDSLHDDGYFYVKMSELITERGLLSDLPWIYYGTPHGQFTGLHFLYPVLLIPFVTLDPIYGIKIFTALIFALLSSVFFLLSYRLTSSYGHAYCAMILFWFSSTQFLYRMNLNRPLGSVVLLILLFCYALIYRKWYLLAGISFIFPWLYDGFVIIFGFVGLYAASEYLQTKKIPWLAVSLALTITSVSIITHPYFPKTILHPHFLLINPIYYSGILDSREWQPEALTRLFSPDNFLPVLFLCSILIVLRLKLKTLKPVALFYFLTAGTFLIGLLISSRFIDLFVPLAILSVIIVIKAALKDFPWQKFKQLFSHDHMLRGAVATCIIIIGFLWSTSLINLWRTVRTTPSTYQFYGPALHLQQHTRVGTIIFNTQWDQLPKLFFWNHHNYYITGLNPVFMYAKDQKKYWLWRHISDDELLTCDREDCSSNMKATQTIAKTVKEDFNSRFIFLENSRNPKLKQYLDTTRTFLKTYSDANVSVYRIL